MDDWHSVAQAAQQLGVSERRVRQLLDAGDLDAGWVGPHRVIDGASLRRRATIRPAAGRPLGEALAWLVVDALGHDSPDPLPVPADRGLRHRLRRLLSEEHSVAEWALLLRRRAEPRRYWGHPDLVRELPVDVRISLGGAPAAAAHGFDLSAAGDVSGYVGRADLADVEQEYALEPDPRGAVVLRGYDAGLACSPVAGVPVPVAAAALDLWESEDARLSHAGGVWLASAVARLRPPELP